MTNTKRIIVVIVEGDTEVRLFLPVLKNLLPPENEGYKIIVARPSFPGTDSADMQYGGDVTSYYSDKNIFDVIKDTVLTPICRTEHIMPEDIARVVQLVDIDGVYLTDNKRRAGEGINRPLYIISGNKVFIMARDRDKLITSHKNKRKNLKILSSADAIFFAGQRIPYAIYYFSCNLDQFWTGKMNMSDREKSEYSRKFAREYEDKNCDNNLFLSHFDLDKPHISYKQSWDAIKLGDASIKRGTNAQILIADLQSGFKTWRGEICKDSDVKKAKEKKTEQEPESERGKEREKETPVVCERRGEYEIELFELEREISSELQHDMVITKK